MRSFPTVRLALITQTGSGAAISTTTAFNNPGKRSANWTSTATVGDNLVVGWDADAEL